MFEVYYDLNECGSTEMVMIKDMKILINML